MGATRGVSAAAVHGASTKELSRSGKATAPREGAPLTCIRAPLIGQDGVHLLGDGKTISYVM